MRIEDLRFFIQVAEAGSINQVAQNYYMSQQGVSRIISNLETQLDVKLFYRGKTMQLTPAGKTLLVEARAIEASYLRMMDKANSLSSRWINAKGNIYTIYATPVVCTSLLPDIIATLNQKFPGIFFNVLERLPLEIVEKVAQSDSASARNLAILSIPDFLERESAPLCSGQVRIETLFTDELCVAVSADSPLAGCQSVSLEQLKESPFVLYNTETLMAERILGEWYKEERVTHTTNHGLCRDMVSQGMAVGLTSPFVQFANPDDVVAVPLQERIRIRYGLVRWKNEEPFVEDIAEVIRDAFRKIR